MAQNRRTFLRKSLAMAAAVRAASSEATAQTSSQPDGWKPKPYRRITTEEPGPLRKSRRPMGRARLAGPLRRTAK